MKRILYITNNNYVTQTGINETGIIVNIGYIIKTIK